MKFAVIVVDMLKDTFTGPSGHRIIDEFRAIVPRIRTLVTEARKLGGLIIYANDSFMAEDFLFRGKMPRNAIRGTEGAEVIDELPIMAGDIVLPKRRFSAFFKTDLDMTLRTLGIDTIAVTGLTTEVCVLSTVLDGLANDFYSVLISDCCASRTRETHAALVAAFSRFPTYPTLRVRTADAFLEEVREVVTFNFAPEQ
jgi:nicotinamidase-related amidase